MTERLYTYDELADYLHVSKSWIWKRIREGKLTPQRFSRKVSRIPESEVIRFVWAEKIEGTAQLLGGVDGFTQDRQVVDVKSL